MDPDAYFDRIGLNPDREWAPTLSTLTALQHAHVTTVPFETLSITGDPHGKREGTGVSLALDELYEKIVERRRGGFCYELNGAFTWLLRELGFDADRVAARVISDGDRTPPANHHSILVTLDRRYVVDVGLGLPKLRQPVPLDGSVVTDAGTDWRLVESERPDADYLVQYRDRSAADDGESDGIGRSDTDDDTSGWQDRYDLTTESRDLSYFEATCNYLATAPESIFTGEPTVTIATERGHRRLSTETFSETVDGVTAERSVEPGEWHAVLERAFGLPY